MSKKYLCIFLFVLMMFLLTYYYVSSKISLKLGKENLKLNVTYILDFILQFHTNL